MEGDSGSTISRLGVRASMDCCRDDQALKTDAGPQGVDTQTDQVGVQISPQDWGGGSQERDNFHLSFSHGTPSSTS